MPLWETYQPVQFRPFVKDYSRNHVHTFEDNRAGQRIKLVLDGQQRLSSLYVALKGTYDKRKLYFDVLSGTNSDNHADVKYRFVFSRNDQIKAINQAQLENIKEAQQAKASLEYWMTLSEIIGKHPMDAMLTKSRLADDLQLNADDRLRLDLNMQTASYALTENSEIFKTQVVDSKLPTDDQRRKTAFDVLEIFVRINTQGMALRRSDLIVSMMRLYWPEASSLLPEFLEEINKEHSLQIDNDFAIRCMFSTAGLSTRLDFELLRKKSNVDRLKDNFSRCFDAIRSTLDFVRDECGIDSARLLGGLGTLVPLVYYLFHAPGHAFKNENRADVKRSVYLFALSKVFSQYAESRTGSYVRDYIQPETELAAGAPFRLDWAVEFVNLKAGFDVADERLYGNNVDLSLSLLQRRSGGKVYFDSNKPEIDHIFPKSVLAEKGADPLDINALGNFWILPKGVNRNKSAKHPKDFLANTDDMILDAAFIKREELDYRSFRTFVRRREAAISTQLTKIMGLGASVFKTLQTEDIFLPE